MASIHELTPVFHPQEIEHKIPGEKIDGSLKGKDVLSLNQFDPDTLFSLFKLADRMKSIAENGEPCDVLKGKIITLLFYEPSSRTRASFDAAAKQLGAQTIVVENPQQFSSVSKGETFEDTIRVFEAYSDAIVLRHFQEGSAKKAAEVAKHIPIINGGDGVGEHPTQALLDLYTIWKRYGRLDHLNVLIAGDIKHGRTVHSLLEGLSMFPENKVSLLSPAELKLQREKLQDYREKSLDITEIDSEGDMPKDCDVWYWTRVQTERIKKKSRTKMELERISDRARTIKWVIDRKLRKKDIPKPQERSNLIKFIVNQKLLDEYGGDTILMHPLPRVGEIREEVDDDPRSMYFEQVENGLFIRMALLIKQFGRENWATDPQISQSHRGPFRRNGR